MTVRLWRKRMRRAGWMVAWVLDFLSDWQRLLHWSFWGLFAYAIWFGGSYMASLDEAAKPEHFKKAILGSSDPRVVICMKQYVPRWRDQQKDKPITPRQLNRMKSICEEELEKAAGMIDQAQMIKDAIK